MGVALFKRDLNTEVKNRRTRTRQPHPSKVFNRLFVIKLQIFMKH
jgi:hypothetical protein